MSARSHSAMILKHMERFGSITQLEALQRYGCMRLGARIYDLRQRGHSIGKETEKALTGGRYARYFLTNQAMKKQ